MDGRKGRIVDPVAGWDESLKSWPMLDFDVLDLKFRSSLVESSESTDLVVSVMSCCCAEPFPLSGVEEAQ